MSERRFTDQDVALILKRAAELDRSAAPNSLARGLSGSELEEIAREVGIDPRMVARAVAELDDHRRSSSELLLGEAPMHRQTRVVPRALDRSALQSLVAAVDESVPAQGTVSEALGAVRWSASDRILSRQVAIKPSEHETLIRVEERYTHAIRGVLHGIPSAYGVVFGLAWGLEGIGGLGPGLGLAAALGAGGWALGRALWSAVSRRSRRRVHALADRLTEEADRMGEPEEG
ncbi:MAG: hypothetical protein PVJ02_09625 [Gemmatimonadota bacterium]|jgi:hypothetical protein